MTAELRTVEAVAEQSQGKQVRGFWDCKGPFAVLGADDTDRIA